MCRDPVPDQPSIDSPSPLAWTVTPETNRWLGLLAYGLLAPLGALALTLLVGAAALTAVSIRDGSWGLLLLLAVAVVVALARPPILTAILHDETDASLGYDGWEPSRIGLLAASTLCGLAMLAASLHSRVAAGLVAVLSFAAGLLAMTLLTDASIDDLRLETQQTGVDLSTLSRVRSLDIGGVTAFWLSYTRGADGVRNPRVLAVPRERAAQVRERLDAGVKADAGADPISHTERAVVVLFGLGVLATGAALALLVGDTAEGGVLVVGYAGTFALVFAAPILWYAWKG